MFHVPFLRGFTIIETLVAIAILLIVITAPLTIAQKGLASAGAAKSEITAFYLAQEAIEYVRNARDSNAISGEKKWLKGLEDCVRDKPTDETGGCGIDPTTSQGQQVRSCDKVNDCVLTQYTADNDKIACASEKQCGLFGHRTATGWTSTVFSRRVFIDSINADEVRITVKVDWQAGSLGLRTIWVSENLMNWYVQ